MNRIFCVFSLALSLALLASVTVFFSAPHQAAAAGICKVGIYNAPTDATWSTDVQSKLNSTGLFTQVDVHDASSSTPSLSELQEYNAVLVFNDTYFANSTALGNALADYADAGGGVVVASLAFDSGSTAISGRIVTGGYLPFTQGLSDQGTPLTLIADLPTHPILAGVSSFNGGLYSLHNTISLAAGATQVAHWSNAIPLVATKQPAAGKIVGLNFYPPSKSVRPGFWDNATDGARLMGNSLVWAQSSSTTTSTSTSSSKSSSTSSSTSTTTTVASTTTTGWCPSTKVLGADNPDLENLRDFRDSTLAQSAVGRKIIEIYYNNADSINAALEEHPALRAVTRKVLEVIAAMVGNKE